MHSEVITHKTQLLTLTANAQEHFCSLLIKEFDSTDVNLRISVTDPGTLKADVGITFCQQGDEESSDLKIEYPRFNLFIDKQAVAALRDSVIDFQRNEFGGQLSVKAPFIRGSAPAKDSPLSERVQYLLDTEINPNLASHGGFVTLEEIVDNAIVVLRFGGGCHGCGMADVTLKSGIEKTLMQQCPDIRQIKDATDHASGENPYYK